MFFEIFAFDGVIGHSLFEIPKTNISKVFLAHFHNISSINNIREIFRTGFVFIY